MANSGSTDMMVVTDQDGSVQVFSPGQLPPGTAVANPRMIRVSGPSLIVSPRGRLTAQQFQDWQ
jgi:hypothetical protein